MIGYWRTCWGCAVVERGGWDYEFFLPYEKNGQRGRNKFFLGGWKNQPATDFFAWMQRDGNLYRHGGDVVVFSRISLRSRPCWFGVIWWRDFQSAFCDIQRPLHTWEPPGNKETEQSHVIHVGKCVSEIYRWISLTYIDGMAPFFWNSRNLSRSSNGCDFGFRRKNCWSYHCKLGCVFFVCVFWRIVP